MSYKKIWAIIGCLSILCMAAVSGSRATSDTTAATQTAAVAVSPTPKPALISPAKNSRSKVVSGKYDELLIGVSENGELTGYYSTSTGGGQFTCIFYIRGRLRNDAADITTWFPESKEQIRGKLEFAEEDGKPGVNIKLESEHGGCWNASPLKFAEETGGTIALEQAGDWQMVRVVSAPKAYFCASPNRAAKQKTFVVKGDGVRIFKTRNGWVEAEFENYCIDARCLKSKTTRGWLKESDLFSSEPPK